MSWHPIKVKKVQLTDKGRHAIKNSDFNIIESREYHYIRPNRGMLGDKFTITEHTPGSASKVYVTRGSAGATPAERRANLALPPNNSVSYEGSIALTRPQILLEGKVAPQLQWGADKVGSGWQIVTAGGRYSGATELL